MKDIKYVSFDSKSTLSYPIGVSKCDLHIAEMINKGHSAACFSDLGNYASFYELHTYRKNPGKSKIIKNALEKSGRDTLDVVFACEVRVFDDITGTYLSNDQLQSKVVSKDRRYNTKKNQEALHHKDKGAPEVLLNIQGTSRYQGDSVILIAKSSEGHSNLCQIVSESSLPDYMYGKTKRIPLSRLIELNSDIAILVKTNNSAIKRLIEDQETEEASTYLDILCKNFETVMFGIQAMQNSHIWDTEIGNYVMRGDQKDYQALTNDFLINYAKKNHLEDYIILSQNSYLPADEFKVCQDILIECSDLAIKKFQEPLSVMSVEEMFARFNKYYPLSEEDFIRYCENSYRIAQNCKNIEIDTSFKIREPEYELLKVNNPVSLNADYLEMLKSEGVVKAVKDEYLFKLLTLRELHKHNSLKNAKWASEKLKSLSYDQIVDHKATIATSEKLDNVTTYLDEYWQKNKSIPVVNQIFRMSKKKPGLATLLRQIVSLQKADLDNEQRRKNIFNELKTISLNGIIELSPYFLKFSITTDFVKSIDKTVGPGRGSGVGSEVCYATDITNIVPWDWQLFFERFLVSERIGEVTIPFSAHNIDDYSPTPDEIDYILKYELLEKMLEDKKKELKGRALKQFDDEMFYIECHPEIANYLLSIKEEKFFQKDNENGSIVAHLLGLTDYPEKDLNQTEPSMPDIDYDTNARDEVCEFYRRLYGVEYTLYIGTYGKVGLKSAFQKIMKAKVPDVPHKEVLKLGKEFERFSPLEDEDGNKESTLEFFLRVSQESESLNKLFTKNKAAREAMEYCLGSYMNSGVHAGGFCLSPIPVYRHLPLTFEKGKGYVSQLAKDELEGCGFVKDDILGLNTLTVIERACKMYNENYPEKKSISFEQIVKTNDQMVLNNYMIKDMNAGVFQTGSATASSMMSSLKAVNRETLPLFQALLRPGPMGSNFHNNARDLINGVKEVEYFHDSLIDILSPTQGLVVYQEQVMAIFRLIGGFNGFEADDARRAMGKKKYSILEGYKERFVNGAIENFGYSKKQATELWQILFKFSEYGFNKSHAVAYSDISYACMWLATHANTEFAAASLDVATENGKKDDVKEYMERWGDMIVSPCVNESKQGFQGKNGKIRVPLQGINGCGDASANAIIRNRPYSSFLDFFFKQKANKCFKTSDTYSLIIAGAFDSFRVDTDKLSSSVKNKSVSLCQFEDYFRSTVKDFEVPLAINDTSGDLLAPADQGILFKMLNELPLDDKDYERISTLIEENGNVSLYSYRRYLIKLLGLTCTAQVPVPEEHLSTPDVYRSFLKVSKAKKGLDDKIKYEKLANKLDNKELKRQQYQIINSKNFDISSDFSDLTGFFSNPIDASVLGSIGSIYTKRLEQFDMELQEIISNKKPILNSLVSFYEDLLHLTPYYEITEHILKRIEASYKNMCLSHFVELIMFQEYTQKNFLFKVPISISYDDMIPHSLKQVYTFMKREEGKVKSNLFNACEAAIATLLIRDKEEAVSLVNKLKSRAVANIVSKISKNVDADNVNAFKDIAAAFHEDREPGDVTAVTHAFVSSALNQEELELVKRAKMANAIYGCFFDNGKYAEREYKNKKQEKQILFNFNLSNKNKSVKCTLFNARNIPVRVPKVETTDESRLLSQFDYTDGYKGLKNYDMVLVKGNVKFSLRYRQELQVIGDEILKNVA